jgi:hypothetical protein
MRRLNLLRAGQIGNGARQLQHPMERSRAHAQLIHRAAHQRFARVVQLAGIRGYAPDLHLHRMRLPATQCRCIRVSEN